MWSAVEAVTNARRLPNVQARKDIISQSWGTVLEASKVKVVCSKVPQQLTQVLVAEGAHFM